MVSSACKGNDAHWPPELALATCGRVKREVRPKVRLRAPRRSWNDRPTRATVVPLEEDQARKLAFGTGVLPRVAVAGIRVSFSSLGAANRGASNRAPSH